MALAGAVVSQQKLSGAAAANSCQKQRKEWTDVSLAVKSTIYLDILVIAEVSIDSPCNQSQSCSQDNLQQSMLAPSSMLQAGRTAWHR